MLVIIRGNWLQIRNTIRTVLLANVSEGETGKMNGFDWLDKF